MTLSPLIDELKDLLINALELEDMTPDDIDPQMSLYGDGLGLDSIDALELGVAIQKKYQVSFQTGAKENEEHFANLTSLASYIAAHRP